MSRDFSFRHERQQHLPGPRQLKSAVHNLIALGAHQQCKEFLLLVHDPFRFDAGHQRRSDVVYCDSVSADLIGAAEAVAARRPLDDSRVKGDGDPGPRNRSHSLERYEVP